MSHSFLLHHMVVLLGFGDASAEIADPLQGKVWWPLEELSRRWLGEAIVLKRR